jgi:hypothetical protein
LRVHDVTSFLVPEAAWCRSHCDTSKAAGERNAPGRANACAKSHARNKKMLKFRWITNGLLIALSLQANQRCLPLADFVEKSAV